MITPTDTQLKRCLAKMLSNIVMFEEYEYPPSHPDNPTVATYSELLWFGTQTEVKDTELLHVCWMVEETLTEKEDVWFLQKLSQQRYRDGESGTIGTLIDRSVHASWQQRTIALAKVKNVEIV